MPELNRELLYEKIAEISEKKSNLIEENENLKKQLAEYHATIFNDFCEFVNIVVDKIDFDKEEINERKELSKEDEMILFLKKAIKNRAREIGINPKELARKVANSLGVGF